MRASLVIPSYRGAQRLPRLLDALATQEFDGEWEAIVVLDGVVDDSESIVASVRNLPVRLIALPENQGRSAALNAGFDAARGEVLIRCDDDLEPGSDFIAAHVRAHRAVDAVGVVGLYRNVFEDTPYARAYGRSYDRRVRAGAYDGSEGAPWLFWAGNCSVTRDVFDRVGPYDEAFRDYGWEDIDWGYRLWRSGVPILLDSELETVHHAANANAATRLTRAYASGRARDLFDRKHDQRYQTAPGEGVKARAWGASVAAVSRLGTQERFTRLGSWIDALLPRVPASVGYRCVALGAEAAALGGLRSAARRRGDDAYRGLRR